MKLSPIALFVYNRPEHTRKTLEALSKNFLATSSKLYVFSDGAKDNASASDIKAINEVREIIKSVQWCKEVEVHESKCNKGLAKSIIEGVGLIFNSFDRIIVLEDDIVTTPNFLDFMNKSLQYYSNMKKVYSISGYSTKIKIDSDYKYDVYYTGRASSWGWATWKDRWKGIDWSVSDYPEFSKSLKLKRQFNKWGSDMTSMLQKQMTGKIDSWAIRWCYHQFKYRLLTVTPIESKVINIGFGENASNTSGISRYKSIVDQRLSKSFLFSDELSVHEYVRKQLIKNYSVSTRLKFKILNLLVSK